MSATNPPRVWTLRGSPYDMGVQMGRQCRACVRSMCDTYTTHVVLEFLEKDTRENAELVAAVKDRIMDVVYEKFHDRIPREYMDEMQGIVDGAADTEHVTMPRLLAINFAVDALLYLVYANAFGDIENLEASMFRVQDMCNVRMYGPYMMRDYQFPNGKTFDKYGGLIVRYPEAGSGRRATACLAAPGMVGGVTVMNDAGLTVNVNLLRSASLGDSPLQLSVLVKLRILAEQCTSVQGTERLLRTMPNACPWMISAMDAQNAKRVFEVSGGRVYTRRPGQAPPPPTANAPRAPFASIAEEQAYKARVGNAYTPRLPRDDEDALTVTNFAIVPAVRRGQNTPHINRLEKASVAPVFRYTLFMRYKPRNPRDARRGAMYLAPGQGSGYPNGPVISGALAVSEPSKQTIWFKVGAWKDPWVRVRFMSGHRVEVKKVAF